MQPDIILSFHASPYVCAWFIIIVFAGWLILLGWKTFGPKEFDEETENWASNNDIYKLPKKERLHAMRVYQQYINLHKKENLKIMENYIEEMENEIKHYSASQDSQNASSAPPSKSEQP